MLAESLDWDEVLDVVEEIRAKKLKNNAGRPPQLRALVGAVLLKATRDMTLREAEDLIRHYAPARYLCGLTETDWSPDHNTLHDFEKLLGEEGVRRLNEYVVKKAVREKLADPSLVVGDTTAQEAAIPYPNEMRLMAAFMTSLVVASKHAGTKIKAFVRATRAKFDVAKTTLRDFRLFAKTGDQRRHGIAKMIGHVRQLQAKLAPVLAAASPVRLKRYGKVAFAKVIKLHDVMKDLLPQIQYWHRTGFVAPNKIINLGMSKLYSVVRGKIGKPLEFGLSWGVTRLKGGFVLAHVGDEKKIVDARYVVTSVEDCTRLFGRVPESYGYDRAGHSEANVKTLRALGVKNIGLAPRGQTQWEVDGAVKRRLIKERIRVEPSIGTLKCAKYGFNRPRARSEAMMGHCGQRAALGFNLNRLVTQLAERGGIRLATS